jgi:crotonobetainyl-CoA:carnitine CoA-transferase CaiB-like acyl-CoA transferase
VADQPSALDGIRVLDLTGEMGAYCTKLLADLGADVIKIEPPGGDPARSIGPFVGDETGPGRSLNFLNQNTSKRSITLDLEDEADRDKLRKLVPTADIVAEDFATGYLDGLGLGYEALKKLRGDIILTSITGFGNSGPHKDYLAPDIVGVAMAGIMWLAGDQEDPPNLPFGNQGYFSAAAQAAAGTTMALYHRDVTGEGQQVEVSMQEALLIAQETAMQGYDMTKSVRNRAGARGSLPISIPGFGPYEASDGWIWGYVGAPGGAPWSDLLQYMVDDGKAEDLEESPYKDVIDQLNIKFLTGLVINPEEGKKHIPTLAHINEVFTRFCAAKSKWDLYQEGQGRRLLIGIVSTPEDLAKNPQLKAREYYESIDGSAGTVRYPGAPFRLSETPWRATGAPQAGEHTAEVLEE